MTLSLVKVNSTNLLPDMYISEPDRLCMNTPFPLHGLQIKNKSDSEKVQKFCRFTCLDTQKNSASIENKTKERKTQATHNKKQVTSVPVTTADTDPLKNLKANVKFDTQVSKQTIKQITKSVIRNSGAWVWLDKMKTEHDASYDAIRASELEHIARVIALNSERKLLPKVMLIKVKDGKNVHKKTIIDLYQTSQTQDKPLKKRGV